jgi:folate-binding protein YgfZ
MMTGFEMRDRIVPAAVREDVGAGRVVVMHYGDPAAEYQAIDGAGGLCERAERATLRITGADRAAWLHNLTTNQIKDLKPGRGCYAFALNAKGRILFDLNVLAAAECLWVDLDARRLEVARTHFAKYTIVEDVVVSDVANGTVRMAALGPGGVAAVTSAIGPPPVEPLAGRVCAWSGAEVLMVRHAFCGVDAVELLVPGDAAAPLWDLLTSGGTRALVPVGYQALEVRRIEAGLPAVPHELNEEVVPAETLQLVRAVSHTKGCYLGQEVVERMRAHGSRARQLVGLEFAPGPVLVPPRPLEVDGQAVGTATSFCHSLKFDRLLGLGYVRAAQAAPGTCVSVDGQPGTVRLLPFG